MPAVTARDLKFDVILVPEDEGFSAICLTADIASCGSTEEEALRMVTEAIELYIEGLSDSEIAALPTATHHRVTLRRG
ncbi:MAG: type II toxin-antitoxin system HicB family antitoxin [Actinomycetes bacterium]